MCNACGFYCCAMDSFDDCGCDGCPTSECWTVCDPELGRHGENCDCPDDEYDYDSEGGVDGSPGR